MSLLRGLCLLLSITWTWTTTVWHPLGFDIHEDGDTFNITMRSTGVTLFHHSPESPMIFVGSGDLDFRGKGSHFRISSYVHEKVPLLQFNIYTEMDKDFNDQTFIEFSNCEGSRVVIRLTSSEVHALDLAFIATPTHEKHLWLRMHALLDEHVYGAGQQFTHFDLRGHNFEIWAQEPGIGRDDHEISSFMSNIVEEGRGGRYDRTPYPQSTFVSSQKYLCHLHGTNYMNLDYRNPHFHEIFIHGDPPGISCDARDTWKHLMQRMTFYMERPQMLPDWIHEGAILGIRGDTQRVHDVLSQARTGGVQVSGVLLEDMLGQVDGTSGKMTLWNWEWNQQRFPGLGDMITYLKEQGIRTFGYICPHFSVDSNLYHVAQEHGYLVKNSSGHTYVLDIEGASAGMVDLTNKDAWNWLKGIIKTNLIDLGLGGWMADMGEHSPVDGVFSSGGSTEIIHNKYPLWWAMVNREAVEEAGLLQEVLFFTRSGTGFTSKYTLLNWAGHQNVDLSRSDGLATVVTSALSLGMTGMGLTHFDIGGYTSFRAERSQHGSQVILNLTRTPETLLRSAELAVFTPVMRTTEGTISSINTQFYSTDAILKAFGRLTDLYRKLKPYRLLVQRESRRQGILMQRPLFFHYGDDQETYTIQDQYLYGQDLLVSPVLDEGAQERKLYLPADTWTHVFTGETLTGPKWVTVKSPLGSPPVFYRHNSDFTQLFSSLSQSGNLETCDAKSEHCSTASPPIR